MDKNISLKFSKVFISGGSGMVGGSLRRKFLRMGLNVVSPSRKTLNLTNYLDTLNYIKKESPDLAILSASLVGGIFANKKYPLDFILENSTIYINSIKSLYIHNCKRVIFLSSSCVYPKNSPQPMKVDYSLKGSLELTNKYYTISKILGTNLCNSINSIEGFNYTTLIPSSILGRADNYDPEYSHVLPSILKKTYINKLNNSGVLDV
jgi:GDP-L-fucose synthase